MGPSTHSSNPTDPEAVRAAVKACDAAQAKYTAATSSAQRTAALREYVASAEILMAQLATDEAAPAPRTAPGGEPTHAWMITLQRPIPNGLNTLTFEGGYTAAPGTDRQRAYKEIRAQIDRQRPELAGAVLLFFSLEPYRL
ncbi:hypothetical protein [Streptomyces sp. NRRL WC-3742]|uniref:hypothetical protein n=1 Tax=Streptomyces sp. NRRL WC-3742 TaxID=1463934 RepID=UPI0004C9531C|nr:hypothetical protein [Streptomyces sp. NRRL WC-3742]